MRTVTVRTLGRRLGAYLRMVASGETVLITDRNGVVAELVPPGTTTRPVESDAQLVDGVREGWLTPPTLRTGNPPPRLPVATWEELSVEIDVDRRDR
ncbi:MAG: type II toxin-antitoxin system Phd/YefM family antitoxin [Alphaproteobacteria bacterium]|nr:type II toxin-antitoxin system Phd/YefM family antitoxin [Alphaproteobacteria bacterium]